MKWYRYSENDPSTHPYGLEGSYVWVWFKGVRVGHDDATGEIVTREYEDLRIAWVEWDGDLNFGEDIYNAGDIVGFSEAIPAVQIPDESELIDRSLKPERYTKLGNMEVKK